MLSAEISLSDSLDDPFLLAKRAAVVLFHPQTHATVVKGVIAVAPDHHAVVVLVLRLTPEAGVHDLNSADGAGVALDVPTPHSDAVPFFKGEHFTPGGRRRGRRRSFAFDDDRCVLHRLVSVSHLYFF